jgi:tetratricopeptide (TPR) repeat protein
MKHLLIFFLLFVSAVLTSSYSREISPHIRAFEEAYDAWDDSLFRAAHDSFSPRSDTGIYWRSVIAFHRVNFYLYGFEYHRDEKKAQGIISAALEELKEAESMNGFDGELYALRATLRGIQITFNPLRAPIVGPQVQNDLDAAFEAGPHNPRNLYLLGVSYYHMPGFVGGGFERAQEYLEDAVGYFSQEQERGYRNRPWGHSTALAFLGEIHRREENVSAAEHWYRRALEVNPEDGLAKKGLLNMGVDI